LPEPFIEQLKSLTFAGNNLFEWLIALGTGLLIYLALVLLIRLVRSNLNRISKKTSTIVDDLLAAALESTKGLLLLLVGLLLGTQLLETETWGGWLETALFVLIVLQIILWLNRAVSAYLSHYTETHRESNPGSITAVQGFSFLMRVFLWSLGLLLVIDNLGYDVTALVAGLGIGGIAIALAVQNVLGDLFASLSIMLDRPFLVGDFIIVGDLLGVVEKIGIKTTRVRSLSGEQLIFSNSDLLSSRIRNFKRMYERRVPFTFGVLYQTPPDQLEAIPPLVKDIIQNLENTRFDRAHFKGFGASSYDFEIVYYVLSPDYALYMDVQQKINLAICRAFAERGISFAYPTRTLYVHSEDSPEENPQV